MTDVKVKVNIFNFVNIYTYLLVKLRYNSSSLNVILFNILIYSFSKDEHKF